MSRLPWPQLFDRIAPKLEGVGKANSAGWVPFQCPIPENHQNGDRHASARAHPQKGGVKCMSRNCPIGSNLNDLAVYLGVDCDELEPSRNGDDPLHRLTRERMLSASALHDKYGVATIRGGWAFAVDDADAKGNPHNKRDPQRWDDEGAPKNWWPKGQNVPAKDLVYGLSHIEQGVKVAYAAAGEIDAITLIEAGHPAFTFLAGEGTTPSAKAVQKLIAHGIEEVRFVFDVDAAGRDGAPNAGQACGREGLRVHIVSLPDDLGEGGDINDLWKRCKGDREAFDSALLACPVTAVQPPDQELMPAEDNPPAVHGDTFPRTDVGNAEWFAHLYSDRLRFDHQRNQWLLWDGRRSRPDPDAEVYRLAIEASRDRYRSAGKIDDLKEREAEAGWAIKSEQRARIDATLALGKVQAGIADAGDGWDADPWLFNVENGTIDLRTGKLREHRQADKITKLAPVEYDPDATCPLWDAFLDRILDGRPELVEYLQRLVGYSLTGSVIEQIIVLLIGIGANGKSTLTELLLALFGDYGTMAAPGLLLTSKNERHPTELADLYRKRFVASMEVGEGKRLAETLVKQLSGSDTIKARRMNENFWEFKPTHQLWLGANYKPEIKGADLAIWRRIRLIPFDVVIPPGERNKNLLAQLKTELPGVLAWGVRGYLAYQKNGLEPPAAVTDATAAYREESDVLADFLIERCVVGEGYSVQARVLYKAYTAWAGDQGLQKGEVLSSTMFGRKMGQRFKKTKNGIIAYQGITTATDSVSRQAPLPKQAGTEEDLTTENAVDGVDNGEPTLHDKNDDRSDLEGSTEGFESNDPVLPPSGSIYPRVEGNLEKPSNPPDRPDEQCSECPVKVSYYDSKGTPFCTTHGPGPGGGAR